MTFLVRTSFTSMSLSFTGTNFPRLVTLTFAFKYHLLVGCVSMQHVMLGASNEKITAILSVSLPRAIASQLDLPHSLALTRTLAARRSLKGARVQHDFLSYCS